MDRAANQGMEMSCKAGRGTRKGDASRGKLRDSDSGAVSSAWEHLGEKNLTGVTKIRDVVS